MSTYKTILRRKEEIANGTMAFHFEKPLGFAFKAGQQATKAESREREMNIKIKRAYEQPDKDDGMRILVDRLWPRGLTKEKARIDLWLKEIAPSTELRKWFAHDPGKWKSFRGRYETEIRHNEHLTKALKDKARERTVTLIYAARDEKHNEALVLKQFLERERNPLHDQQTHSWQENDQ